MKALGAGLFLAVMLLGVYMASTAHVRHGRLVTVDGHRTVMLKGCPCDSLKHARRWVWGRR